MNGTNDELDKLMHEARWGKEIWHELKMSLDLRNTDLLLVMQKCQDAFVHQGIESLKMYMESKRFTKAVIIIDDIHLKDFVNCVLRHDIYVVKYLEEPQMSALLRFYRLVQFFPNIVVVSYDKPFASKGLLKCGRISAEEFIENTLYV